MSAKPITISVELSEETAWQLAQFIKRVGFNTVMAHTDMGQSNAEAYTMLEGLELVGRALRKKGIAPR